MASQWTLTRVEARLIEELRALERRATEFKLEIIGHVSHGKRMYQLRPTPYLSVASEDRLSVAIDD